MRQLTTEYSEVVSWDELNNGIRFAVHGDHQHRVELS